MTWDKRWNRAAILSLLLPCIAGGSPPPKQIDGLAFRPRRVSGLPKDIRAGAGRAFFRTFDPPTLWVTDGTPAGTLPLVQQERPLSLDPVFGTPELEFLLSFGGDGQDLAVTQGTPETTVNLTEGLRSRPRFYSPDQVVILGPRRILIGASDIFALQLWTSDGTRSGTKRVFTQPPLLNRKITSLVRSGDRAFFVASDWEHGTSVWVTEGTAASTRRIFSPGGSAYLGRGPGNFAVLGAKLLFFSRGRNRGYEPWISDGTAKGTRPLKDIVPGPDGIPGVSLRTVIGRRALFEVGDQDQNDTLWASDGTSEGTVPIARFGEARIRIINSVRTAERWFFEVAKDGEDSVDQWVSDGTQAGTRRLEGPCLRHCFGAGLRGRVGADRFLYIDWSPARGLELWATGTEGQRELLAGNFCQGCAPPAPGTGTFLFAGPKAYIALEENGQNGLLRGLWVTDGTAQGTTRLPVDYQDTGFDLDGASIGRKLVFAGVGDTEGPGLWVTDGTVSGTRFVAELPAERARTAP